MKKNALVILFSVLILIILSGCELYSTPESAQAKKEAMNKAESKVSEKSEVKTSNKEKHGDFLNHFEYDSDSCIWYSFDEYEGKVEKLVYIEKTDELFSLIDTYVPQIYNWETDEWIDTDIDVYKTEWANKIFKVESRFADRIEDFTYVSEYNIYFNEDIDGRYVYDANQDKMYRFNAMGGGTSIQSDTSDSFLIDFDANKNVWYNDIIKPYNVSEEYYADGSDEYYEDLYGVEYNGNLSESIEEGFDSLERGMMDIMLNNAIEAEKNYVPSRQKSSNWRYEVFTGKWFYNEGDAVYPSWREQLSYDGPENYNPDISYNWYYNNLTYEWVFFNSDDGEFYDYSFPYTEYKLRLVSPDYYEYTGLLVDLGNGWRQLGNFNVFQDTKNGIWYKYTNIISPEWNYNDSGSNMWYKCDDTFVPPTDL